MTVKVYEDMVAGSVDITRGQGVTATRVFKVENATGSPSQIIYHSVITGALPKIGDPHPGIPNIFLESLNGNPINSNIVQVTAKYSPPTFRNPEEAAKVQISVSGTIQNVQTNKHIVRNGAIEEEELMTLEYTYPKGQAPDGVDKEKKSIPTVEKQVANIVIRMTRLEEENPINLANQYVSKLNLKKFLGTAQFTWMCTNISGQSNDGGESYQNTYEFQYAPDGWKIDAAFADEQTGKIPADIEEGVNKNKALKNFRLQRSIDFKALKLEGF
jgi:hypothetical protein